MGIIDADHHPEASDTTGASGGDLTSLVLARGNVNPPVDVELRRRHMVDSLPSPAISSTDSTAPTSSPPVPVQLVTQIVVAGPQSNNSSFRISWKILYALLGFTLSLYFAWGVVREINNTLGLLGQPFMFIAGVGSSLSGFGCKISRSLCPDSSPHPALSTPPQQLPDYSQITAALAAQLDSEAVHADSLTALILSFANGTAIKLLKYRRQDIQAVSRELLVSDLPARVEFYDTAQTICDEVFALSDMLIDLNTFGSMALDFFVRQFIALEGDIQKMAVDPKQDTYQALGRRVKQFVDGFSERIAAYTGIVDKTKRSAEQVDNSVRELLRRMIETQHNLRDQVNSKGGSFYQKTWQPLTIAGRHEISNFEVLLSTTPRMAQIKNELDSARTLLGVMEKGAHHLQKELKSEFLVSDHLDPSEALHRFTDTVVSMQKKKPEYKELFKIDMVS
ncbi:hypothetical protein C8R46DRAFT_547666 [Mycena filopes]|nr:hypothetical protein C8R46DRAFT_547666 [Mycena filopes]